MTNEPERGYQSMLIIGGGIDIQVKVGPGTLYGIFSSNQFDGCQIDIYDSNGAFTNQKGFLQAFPGGENLEEVLEMKFVNGLQVQTGGDGKITVVYT